MLHEAAPCTCGLLYGSCGGGCSMLFAAAPGDHHYYTKQCVDDGSYATYGGSVDCTLSLGTPSTRRAEAGVRAPAAGLPWEAVPSCNGRQDIGPARADQSNAGAASARRCANCDTTSTPLWRNGPRGPKSLCNACGIRYKKEERRAAAAAAAPTALASESGIEYAYGYARQQQQQQQQQWGCYGPAVAKAASYGMFGDAAAEDGPCLPWGLGVMPSSPAFGSVREMTSLFQYY
ncbi:GATA transcription factor 15-like [Hordeum vulgare subsp. vulgare]|uniref:GATA-type domain-containing protein n=1 Tax=Hordeum vulgare subsp. vulgare TaxID=112509 RepID=A0A8I6X260_HORVV|nr:GATA transcription factor 15-like [Hordeum vulgare subsp. vulgare]